MTDWKKWHKGSLKWPHSTYQLRSTNVATAGKDRTGVLAILLMNLVDAPKEVASFDYLLTRIGIERERDFLNESLKKWLGEDAMSQPGVAELGSVSPRVAKEFQELFHEKYGGAIGYCKSVLGFSDHDIDLIRKNIARQ
jgi:protein tyrosine/serine phosphatase